MHQFEYLDEGYVATMYYVWGNPKPPHKARVPTLHNEAQQCPHEGLHGILDEETQCPQVEGKLCFGDHVCPNVKTLNLCQMP